MHLRPSLNRRRRTHLLVPGQQAIRPIWALHSIDDEQTPSLSASSADPPTHLNPPRHGDRRRRIWRAILHPECPSESSRGKLGFCVKASHRTNSVTHSHRLLLARVIACSPSPLDRGREPGKGQQCTMLRTAGRTLSRALHRSVAQRSAPGRSLTPGQVSAVVVSQRWFSATGFNLAGHTGMFCDCPVTIL